MDNNQELLSRVNTICGDFLPLYKEILLTWIELEIDEINYPYLIVLEFNNSNTGVHDVIEHRLISRDKTINMYQLRIDINKFEELNKWLFLKENMFLDFSKHTTLNNINISRNYYLHRNLNGKPIHYIDISFNILNLRDIYTFDYDSEEFFLDLKTNNIYPKFRKVYDAIINAEISREYSIIYKINDYRGSITVRNAFDTIFINFFPSPKYDIEKYALLIESESENYHNTLWGEDIDNPNGIGDLTNEVLSLSLFWNLSRIQQIKLNMKETQPSEIGIMALYATQDRVGISSLQDNEIRKLNVELNNIRHPKFDDIAETYLETFKIQNVEKRRSAIVDSTIILEEFIKRIYLKNSITITGKGTLHDHITNPLGIFRNNRPLIKEINSVSKSHKDEKDFDLKWRYFLKNDKNSVESNKICLVLLTRNLEKHKGGHLRIWTVSEDFQITFSSVLGVLLFIYEIAIKEGFI